MRKAVYLVLLPGIVTATAALHLEAGTPRTRRIEVTTSRYAFEPAVVEVAPGDTVELVVRSADTDHGLAIREYAVKVEAPKGGAARSATFVADKPGRFAIECSEYCGSGHKRMRGELLVTESAR